MGDSLRSGHTDRRLITAILAVAVATPSCRSGTGQPAPLHPNEGGFRLYMTLPRAGIVGIYGARTFTVDRPTTLLEAVPAVVPTGVTLLDARLSYLKSAGGARTVNGYPGGICTDVWPPAGYGPTTPVAGASLEPGDVIALTFYLRAERTGRFDVQGYAIGYRDEDGDEGSLRRPDDGVVEVEALAPGGTSEHRVCDVTRDSVWVLPARK